MSHVPGHVDKNGITPGAYPTAGSPDAAGQVAGYAVANEDFLAQITGLSPTLGAADPNSQGGVAFDAWSDPTPMIRSQVKGPANKGPGQAFSASDTISSHAAMVRIMELPPEQIKNWKNAIYDSGLYSPSMYSRGVKPRQNGLLESSDIEAFNELMYISTRAPKGTTVQDVLEQMGGENPFSAKNNFGKEPKQGNVQQIDVSDPATIRKIARAAATELLGRDLDDKTLERLVGVMQNAEKSTGQSNANAVNAGVAAAEGGANQTVTTQSIDVGSRTEEQIAAENPGEVEAKKFANGMDSFFKMLSGGQ